MTVTAIATFAMLTLQRRGFRPIELLIGGLVALIGARNDVERRKLLRFSNREVVRVLGLAGLVNMVMLAMAAAVPHDGTHDDKLLARNNRPGA